MLKRITTNWTVIRAVYLITGALLIVNSVSEKRWIGLIPGIYFAAMSIFNFGCAAGACGYAGYENQTDRADKKTGTNITYEEVK